MWIQLLWFWVKEMITSKLSERKWCSGFPEQMWTQSQRSLMSQLTRLENEYMFSKFPYFASHLFAGPERQPDVSVMLFRNQNLTCFKWESIQVCLEVLEASIAILKILNTMLLLNYVACSGVVQCFPQLKTELRI